MEERRQDLRRARCQHACVSDDGVLQAHHLPGATGQDFSPAARPGTTGSSDGLLGQRSPATLGRSR